MDELLKVGILVKPHGVRGEVKVYPTTDDVKRFSALKEVLLKTAQGREQTLHIVSVKYQKNLVILKFQEIDTPEEMEKLRKAELFVTRENAVKLQKDEYFIADLIGMKVTSEDGTVKGELTDVLRTGANDVYEVQLSGGKSVLLPAIKDCIISIDPDERLVTFRMMNGLM